LVKIRLCYSYEMNILMDQRGHLIGQFDGHSLCLSGLGQSLGEALAFGLLPGCDHLLLQLLSLGDGRHVNEEGAQLKAELFGAFLIEKQVLISPDD